ncbi:MAG: CoA pyrophosphatase [Bacteroidota bacterium]
MHHLSAETLLQQLKGAIPSASRRVLAVEGFRAAAVLVPLMLDERAPSFLLTKRTESVETHKGQISFPGGMAAEGDRDLIHTALRETEEELGIDPRSVEVVGMLDDLATPTGFIITPVLGILWRLPRLTPNPHEVADVFTVPVEFFRDPARGKVQLVEFMGEHRELWYYETGDYIVWGATAMIIRSLLKQVDLV